MLRLEPRLTTVRTLAFSPDNQYLLAVGVKSGLGGLLRFSRFALYDLTDPTASPTLRIDDGLDPIAGFFLPDGRALGVDNRGSWRIAGIDGGEVVREDRFRLFGRFEPAAVSRQGRWLAVVGSQRIECLPLPGEGAEGRQPWTARLERNVDAITAGFSPGEEALACLTRSTYPGEGATATRGQLLDADNGQHVGWFAARAFAFHLAWAPDRLFLVTISPSGFSVYDLLTKETIAEREVQNGVTTAAFHPAGRSFATAGHVGTVQLWDVTEWHEKSNDPERPPARTLDWGVGGIQALAFSPDGTLGAVAGKQGGVVVWDADE
jgi:hypothetical protein